MRKVRMGMVDGGPDAFICALPKSQRMDFVVIVMPNHLHFLVLRDKPATVSLAQALELELEIYKSKWLCGLTCAYANYLLIKQAEELVKTGEFGAVKKVIVEYTRLVCKK
ncbi:hypothetical protein HG263_17015 [Pseudoalteromonas sp. JBTF-M23]|uniref:Uncharacterized protein n=1 Tax=Pseudoalteromonas caenipelagi TaxID=2726988 RepID=A0A849VFN9_9GAMM|nr:hypothetical protein [Pseudoalteromonas caenipelagi]NOU52232.1 hypothetical protein [Pseudoalteromonas caenipelagi]